MPRTISLSLKNQQAVSFSQISNIVTLKVKAVVDKVSIPAVTSYKIVRVVNAYNDSYRNLIKSLKHDKEKENLKIIF